MHPPPLFRSNPRTPPTPCRWPPTRLIACETAAAGQPTLACRKALPHLSGPRPIPPAQPALAPRNRPAPLSTQPRQQPNRLSPNQHPGQADQAKQDPPKPPQAHEPIPAPPTSITSPTPRHTAQHRSPPTDPPNAPPDVAAPGAATTSVRPPMPGRWSNVHAGPHPPNDLESRAHFPIRTNPLPFNPIITAHPGHPPPSAARRTTAMCRRLTPCCPAPHPTPACSPGSRVPARFAVTPRHPPRPVSGAHSRRTPRPRFEWPPVRHPTPRVTTRPW